MGPLIPALVMAGSTLASRFLGGPSASQRRQQEQSQQSLTQLQNLQAMQLQQQMGRQRQTDPLFQALMQMAMGMVPRGARPTMPTQGAPTLGAPPSPATRMRGRG